MSIKFPKGFFWGSATSAHQVEGGNTNSWSEWEKKNSENLASGKGRRKWAENSPFPKRVSDPKNYISGKAADHYNRYKEDFDIAKSLGQNAHRFSIEWSRIEPEKGKYDEKQIEHYQKVVTSLKARGLEPFITLWHWTLPLWVSDAGGFENKETIDHFTRYAEKVVRALPNVKFWITVNEPLVYASQSYLRGTWPPQNRNVGAYVGVISNLVDAHKKTYAELKKINSNLSIGIAKHNIDFSGKLLPGADWWWNRRFLEKIKQHQDFVGLNYYFGSCKSEQKSDMGWNICPEGIYKVLKDLKKFEKPVYIVENGIADAADTRREKFIKDHLRWVQKAIRDEVDVRGYFYWSLLDNFEWSEGFWPRFGLVEINYETLERTIRPSAYEYDKICKSNAL